MRCGKYLLCIGLCILPWGSGNIAVASGPTTFTVHVIGRSIRTALHLQPGFATVLRADHRVDTVAVGDPRLVTATTVKRGQDVYDLVLQPQTGTGVTNMIVWFGDLTSIWDLTIGPRQRTADIVYVVTAPPILQTAPSQASTPEAAGALISPPPPAGQLGGAATPAKSQAPTGGDPYLEIQQTLRDAAGVFQLFRGPNGIKIRYRVTNQGATDVVIQPNGVLIRVNGRLVPFGMSRDGAAKDRPAVLPPGTTAAGTISAPARAPRQVEVIFSVFPAVDRRQAQPNRTVPTTFQLLFAGLERLTGADAP